MKPSKFLMYESSGLKYSFPDESIKIGVAFEVGGAYETWGYIIYKGDQVIATHRNDIEKCCDIAAKKLKKEYEERKE